MWKEALNYHLRCHLWVGVLTLRDCNLRNLIVFTLLGGYDYADKVYDGRVRKQVRARLAIAVDYPSSWTGHSLPRRLCRPFAVLAKGRVVCCDVCLRSRF